VVAARDLVAADRGGTSDPYAVLEVLDGPLGEGKPIKGLSTITAKGKVRTKTIKKTVNPTWDEEFHFDHPPKGSWLTVTVWDDDTMGDDKLGIGKVQLDAIDGGEVWDDWVDMEVTKGAKKATGAVHLIITRAEEGVSVDDHAMAQFEEKIKDFDTLPLEKEGDHGPNELRVAVIQARGLAVMDTKMFGKGGSSDPMVTLNCSHNPKQKTKVVKKSLDPVWREMFSFDVEADKADDAELVLVVDDWDMASGNDFMGQVKIPIGPLRGQPSTRGWYPLLDSDKNNAKKNEGKGGDEHLKTQGEIELKIRWLFNPELAVPMFEDVLEVPDKVPNQLLVAVSRARNLMAMDTSLFAKSGTGTSDPVIKLTCGEVKASTKVVKKSLNPKYNETFKMPETSELELGDELVIVVEDWDLASGNDFMGEVRIALPPRPDQRDQTTKREWYTLCDKLRKDGTGGAEVEERGQIEIITKWTYNKDFNPVYFEGEDDGRPDKPPNELKVALIRARNLPVMDKNMFSKGGSSDPVARLKCGDQPEQKSSVKKKTLSPLWNEVFKFEVRNEKLEVKVTVEDWDQLSGNDLIGWATVPLSDLADRKPLQLWLPLTKIAKRPNTTGDSQAEGVDGDGDDATSRRPKTTGVIKGRRNRGADGDDDMTGEGLGEVELALQWWFNPDNDIEFFTEFDDNLQLFPREEKHANQLHVAVMQAHGLSIMDKSMFSRGPGSSDPLVKLKVLEHGLDHEHADHRKWVKSSVKKKTLDPVWNEKFVFNIDERPETIDEATLEIEVEDWDQLSGNDFMGKVRIMLSPFQDRSVHKAWYPLLDSSLEEDGERGQIEICARWIHNPALKPHFFHEDDDRPDKMANELRVAVIRARKLPIMDKNLFTKGGSSDPLVHLALDGSILKFKSQVQKKTLEPVWQEVFAFPCDVTDPTANVLNVTVEDWDLTSGNDFMGRLVIPLEQFEDRKVHQRFYTLGGPNKHEDLCEEVWVPAEDDGEDDGSDRDGREEDREAKGEDEDDGHGGGKGSWVVTKPPDKDRGQLELAFHWWFNPELNPHFFEDEDDGYPERPPNELRIAVIQGMDLLPMDLSLLSRHGGTSDPYVVVKCKKETRKTSTKKETLMPMWREVLTIPVSDRDATVEVTVMDYDILGDDFMGRVIIPLDPLFDKTRDQSWHVVGGKEGAEDGKSRGEIELALHWWFNPELQPEFFNRPEDEDGYPLREPNQLNVAVVQARGLPAVDRPFTGGGGGSSDPFVRINCGSETEEKTEVKKKQLDPVWNQIFKIGVEDPAEVVRFTIEDMGLVSNTLMGVVEVPLLELHDKHTERGWYSICANQEEAAEKTAKHLKMLRRMGSGSRPSSKGSAASGSSRPESRERGRGDGGGAEVGFVDDGEVTKQSTDQDGDELEAKEEEAKGGDGRDGADFTAPVQAEMGGDEEGGAVVKVTAWNDDEVFDTGPNGQLELAFKWVFNPERAPTYFEDDDGHPEKEVNELRVAVIQARGLPIMDRKLFGSGGTSDPITFLKIGKASKNKLKTKVIYKNLSPKWFEEFSFPLTYDEGLFAEFLDVTVMDWDLTSNDFIGCCRIPLEALGEDRHLEHKWFDLGNEEGVVGTSVQRGKIELAVRWQYNPDLDPDFQDGSKYAWEVNGLSAMERRKQILKKCKNKWAFTEESPDLTLRRIAIDKENSHLIGALLSLDDLKLAKIDLREAGLCSESITAVVKGLVNNHTLRHLNISRNPMSDVKGLHGTTTVNPPLRDLGLVLIKNQCLQHLDLSESTVEPLGLKALAYGLRASSSLRYLSLRANPICNVNSYARGQYKVEGVKALAEAVKTHNTLEHLNLGMTQLCGQNALSQGLYNATGLLYLADALKFSSCLKQLDLSDNNILGEGELVAKSLPTGTGGPNSTHSNRGGSDANHGHVTDAAHEQARGRGRPIVQEIMRQGGYRLHEKLDKGKRRYLVLRRNMEDHNKGGFESF